MDDIDRIMAVMATAFDPRWGEAWNRKQIEGSLGMTNTHYRLIDETGGYPEEGRPAVGFAMVRAAPGEEELLLIAVDPAARRRGLGARLIAQLCEDARARDAERLFLEMRENNPAKDLYLACGFEPIGRRKDYYRTSDGIGIDAITFAKRL